MRTWKITKNRPNGLPNFEKTVNGVCNLVRPIHAPCFAVIRQGDGWRFFELDVVDNNNLSKLFDKVKQVLETMEEDFIEITLFGNIGTIDSKDKLTVLEDW